MAGGVVDGQAVSQAVTDAAFLFSNGPTTGVGSVCLAAPSSGVTIIDVQSTLNIILEGIGGSQVAPATSYGGIPANTIPSGSTHLAGLIAIANIFEKTTGHKHDGTQGGGGPLSAVTGIAVSGQGNLQGQVIFIGGGLATVNEVAPAGTIQIFGTTPNIQQVLDTGNSGATAGINFQGGAIANLSYLDWQESGFPPGAPATGVLRMAASGDDHIYVRTSATATHRVDTSLAASGSSALYGDVILIQGSGVSLSQSGQQITIARAAGGGAINITQPTSGAYTILTTDDLVVGKGASAFVLPAASAVTIKPYYLKSAATGTLIIRTNGTDLLDGATSFPGGLQVQFDSITVMPDGASAWYTF